MRMWISLLTLIVFLAPIATHAAVTDAAIFPNEVQIVPSLPIVGAPLKVYAIIHNNGTTDIEGAATFSMDGVVIAQKPISIRAAGVLEEVCIMVWEN